ncbi:MFS transporter [Aquisphaera insulae]|uniref:MFS transporter n=1 Tax=Aquisphaera insulae TaxID=2712864 RepID=UPI0013EBBE36|nr:MFS transporter [Aquisphaera insulae]
METPSEAPASRPGTIPLLMLVVACGHFNRLAIAVAGAERIIPDYGLSTERMGLVYSAFLLAYTVMMVPGGWFIDRFGARSALLGLTIGSTFFVALTGIAGLLAEDAAALWLGLLVVRTALGAVNAPLHPASARTVADRVPARSRALANGLVTFAACVGMAATYPVFGTLMDRIGWPTAFLVSSGLSLAVTLALAGGLRVSRPTMVHAASHDPASASRVLRRRGVICITISYLAFCYFQYLFFYWMEYYFETIQGLSRESARNDSTMITLVMGVGMIAGGWLSDRAPRSLSPRARRALVPVVGMLGSGIAFEFGLFAPGPTATLAAFAVAAAFTGACEAAFWTTAVELGAPLGGTAAGLMNMGGNLGGMISPALTPLLGSLFATASDPDSGWRTSLAIAGGIVVAGAALWLGIDPSQTERDPGAEP